MSIVNYRTFGNAGFTIFVFLPVIIDFYMKLEDIY